MSFLVRVAAVLACVSSVVSVTQIPAHAGASAPKVTHVPGNIQLFYEQIADFTDSQLIRHLSGADQVVINRQGREAGAGYWPAMRDAAERLRRLGFRPLHYVQYYWLPADAAGAYGVDLQAHPEQAFCRPGRRNPVSAGSQKPGHLYVDLNERAARAAANAYLTKVMTAGFDGFYVDRGYSTYVSGTPAPTKSGAIVQLSNMVSGCTERPVIAGRDLASAHLALLHDWKNNKGATVVLNCCTPLERSWSSVTATNYLTGRYSTIVSESQKPLASDVAAADQGRSSEAAGDVTAFICAETAAVAQYGWARAKLWNQPVTVNTGTGGTGSCSTGSNQWGTHPMLNRVRLGAPLDREPQRSSCDDRGCLLVRRYRAGAVIVNQSSRPATTPAIEVGASSCRRLFEVSAARTTKRSLAGGSCVTAFARRPGPGKSVIVIYTR